MSVFEGIDKLEIDRTECGGILLTQTDGNGSQDSIYVPGWALGMVLAEIRKVATDAE